MIIFRICSYEVCQTRDSALVVLFHTVNAQVDHPSKGNIPQFAKLMGSSEDMSGGYRAYSPNPNPGRMSQYLVSFILTFMIIIMNADSVSLSKNSPADCVRSREGSDT